MIISPVSVWQNTLHLSYFHKNPANSRLSSGCSLHPRVMSGGKRTIQARSCPHYLSPGLVHSSHGPDGIYIVSAPCNRALLLKTVSRRAASFSPGKLAGDTKVTGPNPDLMNQNPHLIKSPDDSSAHKCLRGAALGYLFGACVLFLIIILMSIGFLLNVETMDNSVWIQMMPTTRCLLSVTSQRCHVVLN